MTNAPIPPQRSIEGEQTTQATPPAQVRVHFPDHPPVVTYTILVVTVVVFILQLASQYIYGWDLVAFFAEKINELILEGQVWRLITPVLVHGSYVHIGFNMYALYIFGRSLEPFYGSGRLILLYLVSGFAGVVASFVFIQAPSLGASTAIFGLLGAQGVFAYQHQKVFGQQAKKVLRNIVYIAIVNFILGLYPGIDNWGHFGGLIGGLMVAWFGGPVYQVFRTSTDLRLEDQRGTREFVLAVLGTALVFGLVVVGVFANYL
jgi:rhomboid protease GluP